MDLVTTALVVGATAGVTSVGKEAVRDAYAALKKLIEGRFGENSDVVEAVDGLEKKPESEGRKTTLIEELGAVDASQYTELVDAANALLEQIKAQTDGEQHIQNAVGSHIAQADRGSTATVNVNKPTGSET